MRMLMKSKNLLMSQLTQNEDPLSIQVLLKERVT